MKYVTIIFIICSTMVFGQSEIGGIVVSHEKQAISRANIVLTDAQDHIIAFVFSNKDGSFALKTNDFGDFTLQIRALGYVSKKIPISIIKKNSNIQLSYIEIDKERVQEIKEVVIKRSSPIKVKKDTIEYNAKNFSNGTEQNVEDLLKKLPGVTVDSDGKIKVGNKEVDHVLVENDDLFERGYQTLTQNMPSTPVDKIQVLKNHSKNKLLKNVENNESLAINITLKEEAKSTWFGSVVLASTSYEEKMHQAKVNLMNFSKKQKVYLLYNYNNLGFNEMKGVEYLISPQNQNNAENVGQNINTLSPIRLHQKNFQFEDKRTNFNNDQLVSLNYIYNFKNHWKLNFVSIYNLTENRNYVDSYYKFNFDGNSFTNTESKTWKQNNQNIIAKLELTKELNKRASLQIYNKVSWLDEQNDNRFMFNAQENFQKGDNRLWATESKLVYTKKLDSTRAFVAVARYINQSRPYEFTDDNSIFQDVEGIADAERVQQKLDARLQFAGLKLSYLKKYTENNTLDIQVGNGYRREILLSELFLYNGANQLISFDNSAYRNDIQYQNNELFAHVKYTKSYKKWKLGADVLNRFMVVDLNENKNQTYQLIPSLFVAYENSKTGNFNLNASRNLSTTTIQDVYFNYIYTGNRNFNRSDLGFEILPEYSVSFSYNLGEIYSQYLNFSVSYFTKDRYISNNSIIQQNYSLNQSIIVNDNRNVFASLELRKYLKFLKSRFSLLGGYLYSVSENGINDQPLLQSEFSNYKIGFEMKSGWRKWFNYELGYEWTFNNIESSVNSSKYLDQKGFVNLYFAITPQLQMHSNFDYYNFGNTSQKTTQFWDLKINYLVKKYKSSLYIKANNLLNANSIQRYSITNISESLYTQKLLPRHVVLGVSINF